MSHSMIEKIGKIANQAAHPSLAQINGQAHSTRFYALMKSNEQQLPKPKPLSLSDQALKKPNLLELVQKANQRNSSLGARGIVNEQEIVAEIESAHKKMDDLVTQLKQPDLQLKGSVQNLMRKKLNHIDNSLKKAQSQVGIEGVAYSHEDEVLTPIKRFLGLLSEGQQRMYAVGDAVRAAAAEGKSISPGSLLAVQYQVGVVQHEVEFFSNLLNKCLESTKTIMNIQI